MPRDGTITSLAAYLSATAGLTLTGTLTYTVQVYSSTAPDDTFAPVLGASVDISISGSITAGNTYNNVATGLSIPVNEQDRILIVASSTGGTLLGGSVVGYVSVGLAIT